MLEGTTEAIKAIQANTSPRTKRLHKLECYVDGTQYADRRSFWDESVPVMERAPCIVYPIVASAIRSSVDMVLGEGRWPGITVKGDEAFDPRFNLQEGDEEKLHALIGAIETQARLKPVAREALEAAMGCGTTVLVGCVKRGKLAVERLAAKHCTIKSDENGDPIELDVRYPYTEEFRDADGKWRVRAMLYRRVIDTAADTTYKPAQANENGEEPRWSVASKIQHGLGFCPVHCYRYNHSCSTVADVDGRSVHAELLDEIDALNFALSLKHRAATYASDPQTVEIGVDEDHNPAPDGRQPRVVIGGGIDKATGVNVPAWLDTRPVTGRGSARMRGVGINWRYPNPDTKVEMLSLPGDALVSADNNARDIRSKIAEALGVVFIDPDNAKFSAELSGKALARLYDRQVRLCDRIREDFGDGCLLPVVALLLRIAMAKKDGLYLAGLKEAAPILERFLVDVDGGSRVWMLPDMDLAWGAYFEPDAADCKQLVDMVTAANQGGFITKKTAVEELSEIFNLGSIEEYLEELEEEADEKKAEQLEMMQATAGMAAKPSDDGEDEQAGKPPAKAPAPKQKPPIGAAA